MFNHSDLDHALERLQREDPSLKVRLDPDSGQVRILLPSPRRERKKEGHAYNID